MKTILMRVVLPIFVVAVVCGATWGAQALGWIPDAVAFWLWPSLIAVLFLAFGLVALLRGMRRPLLPLGVGFLMQSLGVILLLTRVFESRWEPLWYTLGAVGVVLLVMLAVWLFNNIRARVLERRLTQGMGDGGSEQDLARIREDMMDALSRLKRAGRGRNAIYELPWYLVMGRPAAGKTVAIKNSGLGLPVRKDWVKGVGGTYTADWFFTNELIFLDTPGKWVTEGTDASGQEHWQQLLKLLRKYRGQRPLDGLVVVVPADDLLSKDESELEDQASNAREIVDLIHQELGFRFPVYLLISKSDLVEGFVDFFRGLPSQRRSEILGWSNEDPNRRNVGRLIADGFSSVQRRLEAYRLEMLGRVARRTQARKLFFFSEDFKQLEQPLTVFAETFFRKDRYHETPVFRGFYFTSGTQGEGAPLSKAMTELSRTLGVTSTVTQESSADEPKRSYFLLDLFRELMVGDEGLIGRTAGHWWRQRRNTLLVAFAPAAVALLVLGLALISFLLNRGLYHEIRTDAPRIVSELNSGSGYLEGDAVAASLEQTGRLRGYHRKMTGFYPMRRLGMRRPGALREDSAKLFRQGFTSAVLRPTLSAAESLATDPGQSCIDRIDVLHSVVWLRMGRRAGSEDMAGFDRVWGLSAEEADEARRELLRQYGYLKANIDRSENNDLLPGFSIYRVARSIEEDCGSQGATSALATYQVFQETCKDATEHAEVEECFAALNEVLRYEQQDYAKFVLHFESLKTDLAQLEPEEAEARRGLELLGTIDLVESQTSECLTRFADTVVPVIRDYAVQDEMLEDCRALVDAISNRGEKFKVRNETLKEQEELLLGQKEDLEELMRDFSLSCRNEVSGFRRLDFAVLDKIATGYRRVACLQLPEERPAAAQPAPRRGPRKPARPKTQWVTASKHVSGDSRRGSWDDKYQEWTLRLQAAESGFDEAQRNLEQGKVRREVNDYSAAYASQWIAYLGGLELASRKTSIPDWLGQLANTSDYATLLGQAAEAIDLGDTTSTAPFDAMTDYLRPLENLDGFVSSDLAEYQAMLGEISQELEQCRESADFFRRYRAELASGDRDHSIVMAREWVAGKAGPGLANNKLRDLFEEPLREAESFVRSDNLLKSEWADLIRLYEEEIEGRAPFAGNTDDEPVSEEGLKAFFGGQTGAVARVLQVADEGTASSGARKWLDHAATLSEIFFESGSDELRPLRVRVTLAERVLDPPGFAKDNRLEEVRFYCGEDADFLWKEGEDESKRLSLRLFGDEGSDYSYVRGTLAEKKGFMARKLPGSDWKPGESYDAMSVEGFWAPLQMIEGGLADEAAGDDLELSYSLEIPISKKKSATANVSFKLSGEEISNLLRLMRDGLEAPPPTITGS